MIVVWAPDHRELADAFKSWAGAGADLRVVFTPDFLVGLDATHRRGYLYDDGWTVEVWIGMGGDELLALLSAEYLAAHCTVERPPRDPAVHQGLHDLVRTSGAPIDEVRHLI